MVSTVYLCRPGVVVIILMGRISFTRPGTFKDQKALDLEPTNYT